MVIELNNSGFEDLTGFSYIYQRDVFRKGSNYYKFNKSCSICGKSYFTRTCYPSIWCSKKCAMKDSEVRKKLSEANKGIKRSSEECNNISLRMSKGGVVVKNLPLFDTYTHQISDIEDVGYIITQDGLKLLQVKCVYCNNWFTPTRSQCENRAQFIKGNTDRESRFYCSTLCKANCPIYHKKKYPSGYNPRSHRNNFNGSDLKAWSKEVLKRADNKCEYCGKKAVLAHHIQPKKLEPFFALDPENGLACCEECHYLYGHKDECSTGNLANKICT